MNDSAREAAEQELSATIDRMQAEQIRLIETVDAIQLERLRAERAYFDIVARILRMPTEDPLVVDLKRRLQSILSDSGQPVPADAPLPSRSTP